MYSLDIMALVFIAFFAAGAVKGLVGLGLPIVVLVFLALPLGVTPAISLMLIPAIVMNIVQALTGPHLGALLRRLWSFLLAAVLGIWLGTKLLAYVEPETTLMVLGALLMLYSAFSLASPQIRAPGRFEPVLSPLAGVLGGIGFGVAGIFIVPGILYLQALGLKKNELVQALGITFITLSATLFGVFVERGVMTSSSTFLSAAALIPAALGLWTGQNFRHRISEERFRQIFFWALLFAGAYFIVTGRS